VSRALIKRVPGHTLGLLLDLDGFHGAPFGSRPDAILKLVRGFATGRVAIHTVLLYHLADALFALFKELRAVRPASPTADAFFLINSDLEHRCTSSAGIEILIRP